MYAILICFRASYIRMLDWIERQHYHRYGLFWFAVLLFYSNILFIVYVERARMKMIDYLR